MYVYINCNFDSEAQLNKNQGAPNYKLGPYYVKYFRK